jgi:hypothetical protein
MHPSNGSIDEIERSLLGKRNRANNAQDDIDTVYAFALRGQPIDYTQSRIAQLHP